MRTLIRVDGTTIEFSTPQPMAEVRKMLNAETLDVVALHSLGAHPLHVLLCDDHGWQSELIEHDGYSELRPVRPLKPINLAATALYRANAIEGTTHAIAGDCYVCPDEDHA